jgi:hypothetical protein
LSNVQLRRREEERGVALSALYIDEAASFAMHFVFVPWAKVVRARGKYVS